MTRTNGFALFRGEDAASRALEAAGRVRRYSKEVLLGWEGELQRPEAARLSGRREVLLAFSLGGEGFPVVHGCADADTGLPAGEFSSLGEGPEGIYGERDALGTRGLWVTKGGGSAGSLASDYRLLSRGAELLDPGATYPGRPGSNPPQRHEEGEERWSFEEAAGELASLIETSVKMRVEGQRRVAVSFSGGLDSSLLAMVASRYCEVVLCTAFVPGSRDERQAERAAALLGLRLETALLDARTVEAGARGAQLPPGEPTLMDKALWCIYSATSTLAAERGARTIILGQLADELFGGYAKYVRRAREEGELAAVRSMETDVRACADRGFLRDEAACSASCEVRFPYADAKIASFASALPLGYKIRDGERKAVLRAAAARLGIPDEIARAPKKAAQFSSGAARLLKSQ